MRILILLIAALPVWGTAFTSKASGDCASGGQTTWNQVGVPGAGDTVTIGAGHAITCTGWTIGAGAPVEGRLTTVTVTNGGSGYTSAPAVTATGGTGKQATLRAVISGGVVTEVQVAWHGRYTVAPTGISFSGGGGSGAAASPGAYVAGSGVYAVTIADNGSLTLSGANTINGDIGCAAGVTDCLIATAGTVITGGGTDGLLYRIGANGSNVWRRIRLNGTASARVRVNAMHFDCGATSGCGNVIADYAYLAPGNGAAYVIRPENSSSTASTYYDVQHTIFDGAGCVWSQYQLGTDSHFVHAYNTHINSGTVCDLQVSAQAAIGSGARQIVGNYFGGRALGATPTTGTVSTYWMDFTITDNLFMGDVARNSSGAYPYATWARNVLRSATGLPAMRGITDAWVFMDFGTPLNAKGASLDPNPAADVPNIEISGLIYESSMQAKGASDWGDVLVWGKNASATGSKTVNYHNSISLPAGIKDGYGTFTTFLSDNSARYLASIDHNTIYVGTRSGAEADTNGGGRVALMEDSTGATVGSVPSLQSNIAWSPGPATYAWVFDVSTTAGLITTGDYNLEYGIVGSTATCPTCTKGYAVNAADTFGAHDLWSVNPRLADPYRIFGRFAAAYLGSTASNGTWASGQTYTTGQTATHSAATYYAGTTLMYRRVGTVGAEDATTEPGVGASWRTHWEFATVQDLGTWHAATTGAGKTISDGAIGCAACSPAEAMVKWVKRGYVPQNPAVWKAGHDGKSIGAVDVSASYPAMIGAII